MSLLSKVKRKMYSTIVRGGGVNQVKLSLNHREITLTDLKKSNLLLQIATEGYESYENELVTLIKNYPWGLEVFVDAGANIGFYSILVESFFGSNTRVIAVEPFPQNIEYIKKIKKINNLSFDLIEKALDEKENIQTTIYYPIASNSSLLSSSASLINSFKGTDGIFNHLPYDTVTVQTTTLPTILQGVNGPCLVKLDCEGQELPILSASDTILAKDHVDFIIEIMINDDDKQKIYELMRSYGYQAYLITNAGLVHEDRPLTFPYPHRKNRTIWKNHFFTKRDIEQVKETSLNLYGYWI